MQEEAASAKGALMYLAKASSKDWVICPIVSHPLRITGVDLELEVETGETPAVAIRASVRAFDRTGVEMEALTAVSVAALTVYDMCKAVDRGMRIAEIRLESKTGGKSGAWRRS